MALWLSVAGGSDSISQDDLAASWNTPTVLLSGTPDLAAQALVNQYLAGLGTRGLPASDQGLWIQSQAGLLAAHQGSTPLSAASLTKVATTLVALHTWGTEYQFETRVSGTGPIENGVLQGDLVIEGSGDPFFVWEEAIALGNALQQLGIRQVTGNLVVIGNFSMNYETSPLKSGQLLKQAINSGLWPGEAATQYQGLPPGTPKPGLVVIGAVKLAKVPLPEQSLLIRHRSLPLIQLLKLMNTYSNNAMAQSLAESLGGAQVVARKAAVIAGFPPREISLINGSGLGPENRISPRAVCAMLVTLDQILRPSLPITKQPTYTIADIFPVMGREQGTLIDRNIPRAAVVKTGTLWNVSALAGVLSTQTYGPIWFVVINGGDNVEGFRKQQDGLLQSLLQQWGMTEQIPVGITPQNSAHQDRYRLGSQTRNERVSKEQSP
ncbi:D-alanyl-D-alanine carboxypeptidase [Leptolyngbya sp. 'hensonii']|uniref:D-alanyl-D-alanine carboxypeptidase n=1 Tax=Leptolyngbya sp. 'hensonii' TaxID=1922337 RepID=UPI001C0DF0A1|nr:D-alanyl-D-alanine carboxypeptidase [Leptolyngbya sp. 'hensonii']